MEKSVSARCLSAVGETNGRLPAAVTNVSWRRCDNSLARVIC